MTDEPLAELVAALRSIAVPVVQVGARRIDSSDLAELHPIERTAVASAVLKRQHEFATGRALLRRLIGVDVAIPVAASRQPSLPSGVVGSLAHDREYVVAAIARDPSIRSLGIDVEPMDPLDSDIARAILRPDESEIDAHLAFTLKEAAYKAWSTAGGRMLEHHEVRLHVSGDHFSADVIPTGDQRHGRFALVAGRCVALVVDFGHDHTP